MIVLASSSDWRWPWSEHADPQVAERTFAATYPGLHAHFQPFVEALKKRQDKGRFWWELRRCAYYEKFDGSKILYQDITWRSQFTFDTKGRMCNNTVYFLTTDSAWLLTVLNSPLLWSFLWRRAVHGKDEALRLFSDFVETIPIAASTEDMLNEVVPAVARLATIADADRQARQDLLAWLRTEFDVVSPGQRLEEFAELSEGDFVAEVRKRRPGKTGKLTPATLRALRDAYAGAATPSRERRTEAAALERRLAGIVNAAYGLTAEEVALLWETTPPRMPEAARPAS